ncbi:MAG TPA: hypothetical protein DDZ84_01700 [Firmicutes bacterium]|nr:hypothetical protein [Bacillota bacterium]
MRVCPTGAIRRHPTTGAVVISKELCVGCRACFSACPVAGMCLDIHGKPAKCDLCNGDPECVKACVAGALEYTEDDAAVRKRRRAFVVESLSPVGRPWESADLGTSKP